MIKWMENNIGNYTDDNKIKIKYYEKIIKYNENENDNIIACSDQW